MNLWVQDIRDIRDKNLDILRKLEGDACVDKLVELNITRQASHLAILMNLCVGQVGESVPGLGTGHCLGRAERGVWRGD